MTEITTTADVATDRPARYGKQLAAHLGRRMGSEWSEDARTGWIQLHRGRATLTCSDATLRIALTCDSDAVGTLEDVLGRHLVRFGAKDELTVTWTREDGTPGTRQIATDAEPERH